MSTSSNPSASPSLSSQIRETITNLEADIEDLEETVRAVEAVGDRWGIPDSEKRARRQFVDRVKREVDALRSKISRSASAAGTAVAAAKGTGNGKGAAGGAGRYTDDPDAAERGAGARNAADEDPEEARRWEMEEQQLLVRRQDDTLGFISGTLHNLASQAGLIGTEVAVQGE